MVQNLVRTSQEYIVFILQRESAIYGNNIFILRINDLSAPCINPNCVVVRHVSINAKCDYWLRHLCLSVSVEQLGPPVKGFLWNLICEYFSKICPENSSFINWLTGRAYFYLKTTRHCLSYIAHFCLEWRVFQTEVAAKIKTCILCSITFFPSKIVPFIR